MFNAELLQDVYQHGWRYGRVSRHGSRKERKRLPPPFLVHGWPDVPGHVTAECDGKCGHPLCAEWHRGFDDARNT